MGHINFSTRGQLLGTVSDVVGYKAGLALGRDELIGHSPAFKAQLSGPLETPVRLHSAEYEELVVGILHGVGYLETDSTNPIGIRMFAKYRRDPKRVKILNALLEEFCKCAMDHFGQPGKEGSNLLDPTPLLMVALDQFGKQGVDMALELLDGVNRDVRDAPHGPCRRIEWKDSLELKELFESESLDVAHGAFIDQRFIDYIESNFDSIDRMNWRKFEGLAGEYFEREGFHVEMGSGRNDDGVDVRVWPKGAEEKIQPTILVQCKRTQSKVGKVVVKALWADVVDAGAASGMIVTTSCLAPGAKKTCAARNYSIEEADRAALKSWLKEMRTPFSGVFLSE